MSVEWEGLNPPYRTIVADPPWEYNEGWPPSLDTSCNHYQTERLPLPYASLAVTDIAQLPVEELAASGCHLYLWTTNRYLRAAFDVVESWGFSPRQTLVWCKPPQGTGPGGAFSVTAEFVVFARRGTLPVQERESSSWWLWHRNGHSVKPAGFLDVVERVSPSPRVELFARSPRLGWDHWGYGYESEAAL